MKKTAFSSRAICVAGFWAVLNLGMTGVTLLAVPAFVHGQVEKVEELRFPPLPELEIPEPERMVLPNGLVVLLMEDHELPLVGVSAMIRTGSRLEPQEKIGLASLTGK